MRTGRPRSFNVSGALDSAMDVFWRKGYQGASLADLTGAMGINSPSLYAAFGNKEGLFRAVLDRYDEKRQEFLDRVLSAPSAREVARLFLDGVVDYAADPKNLPGCLLIQSGLTCADDAVPREIARHREQKEVALRERFERARREGDLPKSADANALARYLMTVSNGMAVQAASGADAEDLRQVARLAIDAWPGGEGVRKQAPRVSKTPRRRSAAKRAAVAA
jgi:AcrR family transcriptional regulator